MYCDPESLSGDPLYAHSGRSAEGGGTALDVYPHELVRVHPAQAAIKPWARRLDLYADPGPVTLRGDASGRAELVLDLGTELEAELEIHAATAAPVTCTVTFGESAPEAEGFGVQGQHPVPTEYWTLTTRGTHRRRFSVRGFRFIRIVMHDVRSPVTLKQIVAHAWFAYRERRGDFRTSDRLLQRVWQASVYTARMVSRPDAYWDGIKRDRLGWYGDARITQLTTDLVFHDPAQAASMLVKLSAASWANDIPSYSFDAVAMLRQLIFAHGVTHPAMPEMVARMNALMGFARRQTNAQGLLIRKDDLAYFFNMGFLDWAQTPVGGRFEELGWLQCKYLEALRNAAAICSYLSRPADARRYSLQADRLAATIVRLFYRRGHGFVHTLNRVTNEWRKPDPNFDYRQTYIAKVRLGPSGPSRHSAALAVLAGLSDTPAMQRAALRTFTSSKIPAIITGFFAYYEHAARAACGDRLGALTHMRDYIGDQLTFDQSPTVSEYFEPEIRDFRRWSLHGFPKSMCHGWSTGMVPLAARYLLGVEPIAPGYAQIALDPTLDYPATYDAHIPTPRGPIRIHRDRRAGPVVYEVPKSIVVTTPGNRPGVQVQQV